MPDQHARDTSTVPAAAPPPCRLQSGASSTDKPETATNYFCPICRHEFLPDEIGKKPHCRRCGYLESCCNPD